jgi:ribose transport system ATP-binding protein
MSQKPLLNIKNIKKSFGYNEVLQDISFSLKEREVIGLLGENGSGKTTLVNILSGALLPDSGSIEIEEKKEMFKSPKDAIYRGVRTVHQDMGLCPDLTVLENIYLGQEKNKRILGIPFMNKEEMEKEANSLFEKMNVQNISLDTKVGDLSGGQQKTVAIARLIVKKAKILLFDEPTASLGQKQKESLIEIISIMKKESAVIYVSHHLDEIRSIVDRVIVIKNGIISLDKKVELVSEDELKRAII